MGVRVEGQEQVEAKELRRRHDAYLAEVPPADRPPDEVGGNGQAPSFSGSSSWAPVDLSPVLDALASGDAVGEQPTMLARSDGLHLLYPARVHALYGETESGKTWLALHACAERLAAGETVLYLDLEDTAAAITGRLLAVGARSEQIRERFLYVNPAERLRDHAAVDLAAALERGPSLTVLDGVTESLALEGLSISDNSDVAAWHDRIPRRIARTGSAALLLDHVTKDREQRGRWAIGAQHKLAGIDGAAYTVRVARPFAREQDGLLVVEIAKDRHGAVRGKAVGRRIAQAAIRSHPGGLTVTLDVPTASGTSSDNFRPTVLMERVSRALEVSGEALGKRAVRERVKGRNDAIDVALQTLVAEGHVTVETGDRGAQLHRLVRRYREDDDTAEDAPHETQEEPL